MVLANAGPGPFVGRGRQSCHLPDLAIHRHEAGQTAKSRADLGGHTFRFYLGHNDERGGRMGAATGALCILRHWQKEETIATVNMVSVVIMLVVVPWQHGRAFTPQIYSKWAPLAPCSAFIGIAASIPVFAQDEHCAFQKALLAMLSFSAIVLVARGISASCNFTQSLNNIRGSRANFGIYQQCGIFLVILVRLWKAQAVYNKTGIESKKIWFSSFSSLEATRPIFLIISPSAGAWAAASGLFMTATALFRPYLRWQGLRCPLAEYYSRQHQCHSFAVFRQRLSAHINLGLDYLKVHLKCAVKQIQQGWTAFCGNAANQQTAFSPSQIQSVREGT